MHPSGCDYAVPCSTLGAGLGSLQNPNGPPVTGSNAMEEFDLQVSISGPHAPAQSTAYQDTHYPNSFLPFCRSVGKLRTYDSEDNAVSGGTPTVIAAKHVAATAAHVFFRHESWKTGVDWDAGERMILWAGDDNSYEIRRVCALLVRHKCYSCDGSSGAAVVHWLENPIPGPYVVAINAGNRFDPDNEHWNIGARMTSARAGAVKDFAAWSA